MFKSIKKYSGSYVSEEGGLFCTIHFNQDSNRYEARVYEYDGKSFDCLTMFAHSKRLILAARPALMMMGN